MSWSANTPLIPPFSLDLHTFRSPMQPFVTYQTLLDPIIEPPRGQVQDVLIAQNGMFLHRQRAEFTAIVPRVWVPAPGLPGVRALGAQEMFKLHVPQVPAALVHHMETRGRVPQPFVETFFYLDWSDGEWQVHQPTQQQTAGRVQPLGVEEGKSSYQRAAIEVHTHPDGCDQFSDLDTQSATGFRVFALITNLSTTPKWVVRVGNEGSFLPLTAHTIFAGVQSCS